MRGIAILFGFQGLGWVFYHFLHVPLPANVLGFIFLTISLLTGWVKMEWVEEAANFLLKYLLLFFIPVVVSTMNYFPLLASQALPIFMSMILSTFAVLAATSWSTQFVNRKERRPGEFTHESLE